MLRKILISMLIATVFLMLGIFVGTKIKKTAVPQGAATNAENTYQAGWDAAKARLAQSPLGIVFPVGMEIKSVSGTIQKIDGNKLTVRINPLEPLADPNLDTRIVTIDSSTKISLNVQKDPAQFQKEMQEFQDKMTQQVQVNSTEEQSVQASLPAFPPAPSEKKDISFSDLRENQQISVTAKEDIKDKKEFTAVEIDAQDIAPAQAYAPAALPQVEAPAAVVPVTTATTTTSIK